MARRRAAIKREILPDPKYKSKKLSKFISMIMLDGKRGVAEKIVYGALDEMDARVADVAPLEMFEKALDNVRPFLEVKSRRVGGATYQVPCEVSVTRGSALAMRWVIGFARAKSGKSMELRLADELMDAFNNQGQAIKKRDDTHKMAEANKAFAHFRW